MNKEAVEKLQRDIDKDSKQVKLLIDKLVNKYCSQLDKEMKYTINRSRKETSVCNEQYTLNISNRSSTNTTI